MNNVMKIEHGKFYRGDDGKKYGPMIASSFAWVQGRASQIDPDWHIDGRARANTTVNLIAEWPDGPVITETIIRKTIKPGAYGPIEISKVYDDGVNIFANPGKWDAPAIRAAIATLSEIADAMEDQE
jgi:hypothetical protein